MTLATPLVSTAPDVRPAGSVPRFPVKTGDQRLVVFPFTFTTTAGALTAQTGGNQLFFEDQTGNVYRVYHPRCRESDFYIYITSESVEPVTVDASNAPSGYTDITLGDVTTVVFSGFLAIRRGLELSAVYANALATMQGGSARHRSKFELQGSVPGLSCFFVRFTVDGSGDLVDDSVEGLAPVAISHSGVGEWTVSTGVDMDTGWVVFAEVETDTCSVVVDAGDAIITATTGEPGAADIVLFAIGPTTPDGQRAMSVANSAVPENSVYSYPMFSYIRDAVFNVFLLAVDVNEDITVDSVTPKGVNISSDGADVYVDTGFATADLSVLLAKDLTTGLPSVADYTSLESEGRFEFGMPAGLTTVVGFLLSGTVDQR